LNIQASEKPHYDGAMVVLWLLPLLTYLGLLFIIAPGRGAAWFSDDGLFLRMSWEAANGYGWDMMLPQSPSYLFDALAMKLGVIELLHLRWLNYTLCLLGSSLFFFGLDRRGLQSRITPLAITASMLVWLNSVECPNSLALHFFLIATGFYFFSIRSAVKTNYLFLMLSALFFALAGFMHGAVAIAVIIIGAIICALNPVARRSLFMPLLLLALLGLWTWYISTVGLSTILRVPVAHETSLLELFHRVTLILKFPFLALLYFALTAYVFKRFQKNALQSAQVFLSWWITALAACSLLWNIAGIQWRFPGWIGMHQIPGAVYYPLLFILISAIGLKYIQFSQTQNTVGPRLSLSFSSIAQFIGGWFKQNGPGSKNHCLFIAIAGFFLIPAGLAAGSNTAILVGLVYFAGPAAGLLLNIQSQADQFLWKRPERKGLVVAWITIFLAFTLSYNHPTLEMPIEGGRIRLEGLPLNGIVETKRYQTSLEQVQKIYTQYDCKNSVLLTMENIPALYYILQHAAPNSIGVVRPLYYFPVDEIRALLTNSAHWCVIDATGIETQTEINRRGGNDVRESIRDLIRSQSTQSFTIPSPSQEIVKDMQFYIR
jgi:hypothetical protein